MIHNKMNLSDKKRSQRALHIRHNLFNSLLLAISILVLITGCDFLESTGISSIEFEYDFTESTHNMEAFFTGYPVGWGENMELTSEYRSLPEPLDTENDAHFISAINHSDNVKMLFRKQVEGLEPNNTYAVGYTVEFATDSPSNAAGIGGAPGESVKVIAASSTLKPEPIIDENSHDDGYYLLNTQYNDDPAAWYDNAIMGDVANSRQYEDGREFELKEVSSVVGHDQVTTDENGEAWILFGTRSGFEGQTDLYYTYLSVEFVK